MKNKWLKCFLLVLAILPAVVSASAQESTGVYYVNPLYADIFPEPVRYEQAASAQSLSLSAQSDEEIPLLGSLADAKDYFRERMIARDENIVFDFPMTNESFGVDTFTNYATMHTGNPKGGDYLMTNYAGLNYSQSYYSRNDGVKISRYYRLSFTMTYMANAAQEAEMDEVFPGVMASLNLDGKSEYEKVKTIYQYICDNVSYDYEHLYSKPQYLPMYSAYAALVNKTAVCQGYAGLLYRMMLAAGVDCRVVKGDAGGGHAWNIVKLGSFWYNADSTWDAGNSPQYYFYFLRPDQNMSGHKCFDYNDAQAWYNEFGYEMTQKDYDPEKITSITLLRDGEEAPETITLDFSKDEGIRLTASVTPSEEAGKVIWKISGDDTSIADMTSVKNECRLSFVRPGTVTLTVSDAGNTVSDSIAITSEPSVPVTGITIMEGTDEAYSAYDVFSGDPKLFTVIVEPEGASQRVIWSSSNENIVSFSETDYGVLVGFDQAGTATLTVSAAEDPNVSDEIAFTVYRWVNNVSLEAEKKTLRPGGTLQIIAVIAPTDAEYPDLNWSSKYPEIATVDDKGLVTAHAVGETRITATNQSGASGSIDISVVPLTESMSINVPNPLQSGSKFTLTVSPADASPEAKWSVAPDSVAAIDPNTGEITLKGNGFITVTAKAGDGSGVTSVYEGIQIRQVLTGVKSFPSKEVYYPGEEIILTHITEPFGMPDIHYSYGVSDPDAILFSDDRSRMYAGEVSHETRVTVYVNAKDQKSGVIVSTSATVIVLPRQTAAYITLLQDGIPVSGTISLDYGQGNTIALEALVGPDGSSQNVTWKSSSTKIARVENGLVTFRKAGTVTITAVSAENKKITAKVKIRVYVLTQDIQLSSESLTLKAGKSAAVKVTFTPAKPASKKLAWTSSDRTCAVVNSSGKVTARRVHAFCSAVITAKTTDGTDIVRLLDVSVTPLASSVDIYRDGISVKGTTIDFSRTEDESVDTIDLTSAVFTEEASQDVKWKSISAKIASVA